MGCPAWYIFNGVDSFLIRLETGWIKAEGIKGRRALARNRRRIGPDEAVVYNGCGLGSVAIDFRSRGGRDGGG
jgi:hypothetical protein